MREITSIHNLHIRTLNYSTFDNKNLKYPITKCIALHDKSKKCNKSNRGKNAL